jgi:hypothetical protein
MVFPRWLKLTLAALALSTLALVVSAWLWLRSASPMSRCDDRAFTSAKWLDSTAAFGPKAIRGCLVDDLLRKHPLRGRSRSEVIALLGQPRRTDYFREYDLVYWLGPERSPISIDSEWLVVRFNSTGRVSQYGLITD